MPLAQRESSIIRVVIWLVNGCFTDSRLGSQALTRCSSGCLVGVDAGECTMRVRLAKRRLSILGRVGANANEAVGPSGRDSIGSDPGGCPTDAML